MASDGTVTFSQPQLQLDTSLFWQQVGPEEKNIYTGTQKIFVTLGRGIPARHRHPVRGGDGGGPLRRGVQRHGGPAARLHQRGVGLTSQPDGLSQYCTLLARTIHTI